MRAELINANLYRLEKGVLYYDLENYYENRILRVRRTRHEPRPELAEIL